MSEPTWIPCNVSYLTGNYRGRGCSAKAQYLVVAGYDAGKHLCGTHARAFTKRALQRIEYPRP